MYGFRGKGEGKGGNDITLLLVLLGIYICKTSLGLHCNLR